MIATLSQPLAIRPHKGPQEEFLRSAADIAIFGGAGGGGKMLAVTTPIATPTGWTTMGELSAGDKVFDDQGQPCNVTAAHPIDFLPESYLVTFDDGSQIKACADHLWVTFTLSEMSALSRRTDEFRERRRAKRESRVSGNKSERFTLALVERNKLRRPPTLPPTTGAIRTTREIANTLTVGDGRTNHAIRVAGELQCPEADLPFDPYLLGLWLGDGCSTTSVFTTADEQLLDEFRHRGYTVKHYSKYDYGIGGMVTKLRELGIHSNKHVPAVYLRASAQQRLAVLQGLMDSDGCACKDSGGVEFTSTSLRLAEGTLELINSLGWKARICEGRATIKGRDCGPKYRIKFKPSKYVFRLERKRALQKLATRRTTAFRYVVNCEKIAPEPMRCIAVDSPSRLYLAGRTMVPTHNTFAVTMEPLRHIGNRRFNALMLRRKTTQILNPGGLWDEASRMYSPLGASPRLQPLKWTFPSGATINYSHLEHEKNKYDYQGAQITLLVFDELTHFTESQFWYMLSRSRSSCGIRPYIRATCNPDADSWVAKLLAWWIDEATGFPIKERAGKLRWFVRDGGELKWANSKAELERDYPHLIPKSITFIPAKLEDNPTLCKADPGYRANLDALNSVDRARLRDGNWKIRHREGAEWPGELFVGTECDWWPSGFEASALAIDPSKGREHGDYAALVFVGLNAGKYYVDSQLGRWPAGVIADRAAEMFRELRPDVIGLEANANQDLAFTPLLDQASAKAHLAPLTSRLWTINNHVAKINRIYRLGPAIQRKQFVFRESPGNRVLLSQLQSFPLNDSHDDGPDALEMSVRLLTEFLTHAEQEAYQTDEVLI
jgi:hypothetical protein